MTPAIALAILAGLWLLTFGISWWNARQCGLYWADGKAMGGLPRFLLWCGAIMAACGFTQCYAILLLPAAYAGQFLFIEQNAAPLITVQDLEAGFALVYLIILPFVLGSGLFIWLTSLYVAWKERSLLSGGIAAWNTFAQIHNTMQAIRGAPEAFGKVAEFVGGAFRGGGDGRAKAVFAIALVVVVAISLGIITTVAIIYKYAGSRQLPDREVIEAEARA